MKNNTPAKIFLFLVLLSFMACGPTTNNPEFLQKVEGRYLFTADEILKVYSKDNVLLIKWRGNNEIQPSKLNEDTFYVKEMNAKIQFLTNPEDSHEYLVFLPKNEGDSIEYIHKKLDTSDKIPSEYLANNEYEKALEGYLAIQKQDSMSPLIKFWNFDKEGRKYLKNDKREHAMNIFKLNAVLHPKESNAYVRLAKIYLESKDTVNALTNYKMALKYNSGSRRLKRIIEKLQRKEAENTN